MCMKLVDMLHLQLEPVGIFFGNTDALPDLDAKPGQRNCVVPFLVAAAQGRIASMTDETCTCPGGTVGVCFGDGFTRKNPSIHIMLSQGFGDKAPEGARPMMVEGERFFCNPDVGMRWRESVPYSDKAFPRVVFAPISRWNEVGIPDLVFVFANPDQISALVAMQGFHSGKACNTLAPFGAACQSIVYAADQIDREEPCAIMGLFDISQRHASLKDYLSITFPYCMWEKMNDGLEKSCLTTHSWRNIEKRL